MKKRNIIVLTSLFMLLIVSISSVSAGDEDKVRREVITVPEGTVIVEVIEHGKEGRDFCGPYNSDSVTLDQYCSSGVWFRYTSCPKGKSGFNSHLIWFNDTEFYQNSQSCASDCTINVFTSWGATYNDGEASSYNSLVDAKFMVCQ